ncbi:MAG: Hsp20/alpha crystallin family protein [Candidatus Izemoplasmatales bacterium]|jgi:HSP20 family molecular chaperone IbpA|nr:Hsp20/alpha crystallin family protein [Candidatus Izemoplasmatales bacterium]MDD4595921.1 Hsp20/alpha crystallin family protein [Candidatus Izemoplasmatales bacterium]
MNNLVRRNKSDLDFFDGIFDGFFPQSFDRTFNHLMKTDIKELDSAYELVIDVPGFAKEEIKISLDNGYLTVEAKHEENTENKEEHFLHRERVVGQMARTYYVGDDITESDISANYDKGILTLSIPKQGTLVKEKKYINIK